MSLSIGKKHHKKQQTHFILGLKCVCQLCLSCTKKNWVKSADLSQKPLVFFFTYKLYHKSIKKSTKTYYAEFFKGKYFSVISYPPFM